MFILYQAFCEETGSGSKKRTPKGKKARTNKKRKVIEADLRNLSTDALNKMKENEMLNALFKDNMQRLLKNMDQPLAGFPSPDLKDRFEKTCKKFSSRFITTARESMWEEFNKLWTDENITKSIMNALNVTSDFCLWFLLYLQQAITKRYLQCESTGNMLDNVDLSDAERDSVAYIAGAVLKKIGDKLWELKRNIKSNGHVVTMVDKEIAILNACKESEEEISDGLGSTNNTSTKLTEALNRGGLIHRKGAIINMFIIVESIFRRKRIKNSKTICNDSLLSESLENVSVQGNFFNATANETVENEQKFRVLENCLKYYIKVRSYAHAKFVIENYRTDTKTERKKKALKKG